MTEGQKLLNIIPEFIAYGYTFGIVMASALGVENIIIPPNITRIGISVFFDCMSLTSISIPNVEEMIYEEIKKIIYLNS